MSIYKNMKDIQNYKNYHEVKFMSNIMELWERVIKHRQRDR